MNLLCLIISNCVTLDDCFYIFLRIVCQQQEKQKDKHNLKPATKLWLPTFHFTLQHLEPKSFELYKKVYTKTKKKLFLIEKKLLNLNEILYR